MQVSKRSTLFPAGPTRRLSKMSRQAKRFSKAPLLYNILHRKCTQIYSSISYHHPDLVIVQDLFTPNSAIVEVRPELWPSQRLLCHLIRLMLCSSLFAEHLMVFDLCRAAYLLRSCHLVGTS